VTDETWAAEIGDEPTPQGGALVDGDDAAIRLQCIDIALRAGAGGDINALLKAAGRLHRFVTKGRSGGADA
jgi:hypothetical protein